MRPEIEVVFVAFVIFFLVGTIFSSSFVAAQSTRTFGGRSAYSVTYQNRPSFQTYYGDNVNTYWPILGDKETCEAREDLMLQMAPVGCQPAVVRSDLLAEQDVPVFCQIDAVKINPLIDISQIRNMRFSGQYPKEVAGAGFHPARAALRTHDTLLGSPLVNNVGYVVVVLKRQPVESKLPESVNITLNAEIDYIADNAYGIGRAEFVLEETTDANWESEKLKQSFWNGRYFVRLEQANDNFADVSVYHGDRKILTTRVNKGETSRRIFVPGMYCRAGLQIAYDEYTAAEKKARIEVSSGGDFDIFDVYEGSKFLDDRCSVRKIEINEDGETGRVLGNCKGEKFELKLNSKNLSLSSGIYGVFEPQNWSVEIKQGDNDIEIKATSKIDELTYTYRLDNSTNLYGHITPSGEIKVLINSTSGEYHPDVPPDKREYYSKIRSALINYKIELGSKSSIEGNLTEINSYFNAAIDNYEEVADDYPYEKDEGGGFYGEGALYRAITLAELFGKDQTKIRLINKYLELYPEGQYAGNYLTNLSRMYEIDSSLAGTAIEFDDKARVIRLVSLSEPKKTASAELRIEGKTVNLNKEDSYSLVHGGRIAGNITLDEVQPNSAKLSVYCFSNGTWSDRKNYNLVVDRPSPDKICGMNIVLDKTNLEEAAKIRIIPSVEGAKTQTNFTVWIGIEKRAIELTPNKVKQRIENLNKSIEKWEKITENLGKVISGLKGACFATAAFLTFKNFMTGLNGETLARQEVMNGENGWRNRCKDMVASKEFPTMDSCYLAKASEIDADVAKTTAALNTVNARIQQIQSQHVTSTDIFGKSVDTTKVRAALAQEIVSKYGGENINMGNKTWAYANGSEIKNVLVKDVLTQQNIENSLISTEALRSMYLNLELRKGVSEGQKKNVNYKLTDMAERVNQNMVIQQNFDKANAMTAQGYPDAFFVGSATQQTRYASVVPLSEKIKGDTGFNQNDVTHIAVVKANPAAAKLEGEKAKRFGAGVYVLGLAGDPQKGIYYVKSVAKQDNATHTTLLSGTDSTDFVDAYSIGNIKSVDRVTYKHPIISSDRKVRYFETEPYRGMPAIVPFDVENGWYAATKQTLPAFGGIGAFDASGRVVSFWICNVGENGRIEINTGYGDDLCQQVNMNTGQPLEMFPGLDQREALNLVSRAERAIEAAARQYGNKFIDIPDGERLEVGQPEVGVPGTECQDFMSPTDCHLMFNVCDPVICPSSRCNLGGTYYVANVVQTGIIGSIFLCLPNIRERILIPVCLTGIHAGIEGLVSIMRNHRDCLQESLDTGQMVGICDQIYSIYLCEFFWNQVAPFVNILIPKIIEFAYGQGARGGAEYLSVMSAWQNMENSINYFTQKYAVNSMTAFQARNVEEVGVEFCKAFISVKSPTAFKTLIEPDSPPQFHAWFDEKTFTTATVPATSQYKVFYHIFAGKDQGVYFNVYLRSPPQSGYYAVSPTVPVASDFIPRGEYASETKDFTAPEGYKELCVRINNDEECGFGQVSSSFAVNYLRDNYIKDEMTQLITSEKECISGTNNLAALLQPNIQAGVEEVVSPEIYNRGVVRICSSKNPGAGTDPGRFVDMGYCDDTKIRCWLDQRSVENAITAGNIGLKNETLDVLEQRMRETLEAGGEILTKDEAEAELRSLKDALDALKNSADKKADAKVLLERAELIFGKLFLNAHKAQLLLIKGETNEEVAKSLWASLQKATGKQEETVGTRQQETSASSFIVVYTLSSQTKEGNKTNLLLNGKSTDYYVEDNLVYLKSGNELIQAGEVFSIENSKGRIGVNDPSNVLGERYEELEGAEIEGWQQYRISAGYVKETTETQPIRPWTFERAINEARSRTGKYSQIGGDNKLTKSLTNKEFVDQLFADRLLTQEEYDEIKGDGLFNLEEYMTYVQEILNKKLSEQQIKTEKCVLSQPKWMKDNTEVSGSVTEGETVTMSINGNNGCNGKEIRFSIYEDDWLFDDFITDKTATISDGRAFADWVAIDDDQEFYFVAFEGTIKSSNSARLKVTKKIIEVFEVDLKIPRTTPLYFRFNENWQWSPDEVSWINVPETRYYDKTPEENYIKIIQALNGKNFAEGKVIIENAQKGILPEDEQGEQQQTGPSCDEEHLGLCDETNCESVGKGYWYGGKCNKELTYQIKVFQYVSNDGGVPQGQGVVIGSDLKLAVEHTCDKVSFRVIFNDEPILNKEVTERAFNEELDTRQQGYYIAIIECKDLEGVVKKRLGPLRAEVIQEVTGPGTGGEIIY